MRKFSLTMVLFIIAGIANSQPSKHVILVTIDGMRPEFYLSNEFAAPNLHLLMKQGVYAKKMTPVFPSVTFPNHTSMITGVTPSTHGIYNNEPFTSNGEWFWYADSIKVPTIFDAARKKGLTTACVLWPVQVGAKIDYNVPDIWDIKTFNRPDSIRKFCNPKGLFEEIEENATGKLNGKNYDEENFSFDETTTRIASYLIKKYKPSFLAIHLVCTDGQEHAHGRDHDSVMLAVANADHCINQLLEAIEKAGIKDSTTIIIAGDHGFVDISKTIFPNVWLKENGLITDNDWKAKFHSGRGSAFLRLKDAEDTATLHEVRELLNHLPKEKRSLFTLIEKEDLQKLGAYKEAVLAIVPKDGYSIGQSSSGDDIRPSANKGTHGYLPSNPKMKTGCIMYGAGIEKGKVIDEMNVTDIAPLIAKLLGIEFKCPDGKLVKGIVKE